MFDNDRPVRLRSHGIKPSPVSHRHALSTRANKTSRHANAGNDMSHTVTAGPSRSPLAQAPRPPSSDSSR
ncbi:hypothetical protein GCM10010324_39500 [Streptomyces hiroshimensis]|uniref:Uncharacterized protein n=1 Tax=Streptomyces hiroshimensis TaxID=66424 RepID=A0ABQ2YPH5_9ACTN|nr:hypothetical protein GCM10010324_39500 [Streptomyces hiroshimensis]